MPEPIPVVIRDRYYVPLRYVDMGRLRELYEVPIQTKEACRPSCPLANKIGRYCSTCPSRDARIRMWEHVTTKTGTRLVAVPCGDKETLEALLGKRIRYIDKRTNVKFRSALAWKGRLRQKGDVDDEGRPLADQRGMLGMWKKHVDAGNTGGTVVSPPRSGKTVIGVAATTMCHRVRTLITASEINWLRQFGKRFGENSNAKELHARGKKPVVIVDPKGWPEAGQFGVLAVKKWGKETDAADVVMSTYQQLIDVGTRTEKWRKHVANRFGKIIADEVDQAAARAFSRVINRTNVRYRLGLTATVHRKDKLERVVETILGRVVVKGKAVSTLPMLELVETGVNSPRSHATWNGIVNFISNSEERNKIIVRRVFKDLRSSKKARVLIPVIRVAHVQQLVKMINQQAAFNRQNRGETWPKELAVSYYGRSNTNDVLNQINSGQARVVVSNVRMVQRGLDVPRWTHVYVGIIPTSNPMITWQLANRVCTPYPKELKAKIGEKPQPVVRVFVDPISASVFCFKRVFEDKLYGLRAGIEGTNFIETKSYKADPHQLARMETIAKYPKSYDPGDAGVKHVLGRTAKGRIRKKAAWQAKKPITKF